MKNKNCFGEDGKKKISKIQDDTENCQLEILPNVLMQYLASFLDFDSLIRFSSTNQRMKRIFLQFRKGSVYFKQIGFNPNHKRKDKKLAEKEIFKQILLEKNFSDLKNKIFSNTPLHFACESKVISLENVKYFVENKCALNAENTCFEIPLHYACKNQNCSLEIIQYLIEQKSSLNSENYKNGSPLHLAFENRNASIEIIKYLVENKSDLNFKNSQLKTPLQIASKNIVFQQKISEKYGEQIKVEQILKDFQK